jgi:hypothetical protein
MHPAEHRGLRELHAAARQLRVHWRELGARLDAVGAGAGASELLRAGSDSAAGLLGELTPACATRGLYARPAAQGLGARAAGARLALVDSALEVNQALRIAVLDATHVAILLDYLARLARRRGDDELDALLGGWAARVREHEDALAAVAVEAADDPDGAIAIATPGLAGRAGHGLAAAIGSAGEWVDGRLRR